MAWRNTAEKCGAKIINTGAHLNLTLSVVTDGVQVLFHFNIVLLTQRDVLYQEHHSVFNTFVSKILAKFLFHFKKAKCHLSNSVAAFGNTHLPFASC